MFAQSFYACRSQKRKNSLMPSVFFVLLGSALVKSVRKMLIKLTQGVNAIKVLPAAFPPLEFIYADLTGTHCKA